MLAKIEYAWRWLGTAFSFLVFGAGGVVLPIIMVPILYCLPGDKLTRERRAQRTIKQIFQFKIPIPEVNQWNESILGMKAEVHRLIFWQLIMVMEQLYDVV